MNNKSKKKANRFDGLTEEEVKKNTLPDYLKPDLDIVFLGINPSLMAAHRGRYYAGPGNHFYKLLHAAELVPRFVSFEEDKNLLEYNIGLTNIVERATRSSADLTPVEIRKGCNVVVEKMKSFRPKIVVFNGKCIYQPFAQKFGKIQINFGLQAEKIGDSVVWVVPSSSARCSNYPRMEDKLEFYQGIKKHLQFIKGEIFDVDLKDFKFENKERQTSIKMRKETKVSARKNNTSRDTLAGDSSDDDIAVVKSNEFVITEILKPILPHSSIKSTNNSPENSNKNSSPEPSIPPDTIDEKKIVKRSWTKPESPGNFMSLIKKRLSEKKVLNDEEIAEKPTKIKKLNYSRLNKLNK